MCIFTCEPLIKKKEKKKALLGYPDTSISINYTDPKTLQLLQQVSILEVFDISWDRQQAYNRRLSTQVQAASYQAHVLVLIQLIRQKVAAQPFHYETLFPHIELCWPPLSISDYVDTGPNLTH